MGSDALCALFPNTLSGREMSTRVSDDWVGDNGQIFF